MRKTRKRMLRLTFTFFAVLIGLFFPCCCSKPAECLPLKIAPQKVCTPPLAVEANTVAVPFPENIPPFQKKLIVIDPGHGGEDLGTQSTTKPRYKEKHLNLATAKMLENFLQYLGYQTVLTRHKDIFISLEKRAEIANNLHCDIFVSVHYNSAPAKQADGIEIFFYRDDQEKGRVASSKLLAQLVLNKIIKNTEAKSRGVKHGDLSVIRNTKMPAILVEGGFLTNDEEMEKLKDPNYLKRVAWGIAQGVHEYLGAGHK